MKIEYHRCSGDKVVLFHVIPSNGGRHEQYIATSQKVSCAPALSSSGDFMPSLRVEIIIEKLDSHLFSF
jgi:hypothetical protein